VPEQRIRVGADRFRIPDLCVVLGSEPAEQILTAPPSLCIEILIASDRRSRVQERIEDFLNFGSPVSGQSIRKAAAPGSPPQAPKPK